MGKVRLLLAGAAVVVIVVLGLAWADAGREPVRPILEDVAVPGSLR